jgi:hypothetical protein
MRRKSRDIQTRKTDSVFFLVSGLVVAASYPLVAKLRATWTANMFDTAQVSYRGCAATVFVLMLALAVGLRLRQERWISDVARLIWAVSLIVMLDRVLLVRYGLPPWIPDFELHYRNRPNLSWEEARRSLPSLRFSTNSYGFKDDEFPVAKPSNEFRGIMLGASITMGDEVENRLTYSKRLESRLMAAPGRFRSVRIINAGVQGYSTFQEKGLLLQSLRFDPDWVTLGFSILSVTEPMLVNRKFGGKGVDYHEVTQAASSFSMYLLNETGMGRMAQEIMFQRRRGREPTAREKALRDVEYAASRPVDDPVTAAGWSSVLSELEEIQKITQARKIPFQLLIFPRTFQLFDPRYQVPDRILKEFANRHGIETIDFTEVFESLLGSKHAPGFKDKLKEYFIDDEHLTNQGHEIVADRIYQTMAKLIAARRS